MILGLASMWNLWRVGSTVVAVMENHEARVCLTYLYFQHIYRVFSVLHIFHGLVLDQITYENDYSNLWHHVVLRVYRKLARMETGLYIYIINFFVRNISMILNMMVPFCILLVTSSFFIWLVQSLHVCVLNFFLGYLDKIPSLVEVEEFITLCVSYIFAPVSCRVDINRKRTLLSVPLRPSTIYSTCIGTLSPQ